ncbi:MAG: NADH-quinone oxidoreductase subunit A [candidate division Zixibacteria bacterium]|nr:NADH-quinone oxidoreductase subunit A [candidate division Zixibacteria bacterium]
MFEVYFPIVAMAALALLAGGALMILSRLFGKVTHSKLKDTPYESGIEPEGSTKERFPVKFYMIALLFIVFDIEVVFLYPWAVIYQWGGAFLFIEMVVFIVILLAGYLYIIKKGALKWD